MPCKIILCKKDPLIDLCFSVLAGEITMLLDGGEETTVKTGQVIIQRGTNHQWINNGTEVCRMLVVMVGAEMVEVNGTKLEETKIGPPK